MKKLLTAIASSLLLSLVVAEATEAARRERRPRPAIASRSTRATRQAASKNTSTRSRNTSTQSRNTSTRSTASLLNSTSTSTSAPRPNCKVDYMAAAHEVGAKPVAECVASDPGQVWDIFYNYAIRGQEAPIIQAAVCVKTSFPKEYNNGVAEAVTFEDNCKLPWE